MDPAAGRPRILFVEDERSISEPFAKALAREGFEPVTAFTAAEALALAERMEFDLVLLDLNLPDASGSSGGSGSDDSGDDDWSGTSFGRSLADTAVFSGLHVTRATWHASTNQHVSAP